MNRNLNILAAEQVTELISHVKNVKQWLLNFTTKEIRLWFTSYVGADFRKGYTERVGGGSLHDYHNRRTDVSWR